jgi:hypothetical protein
LAEAAPEFGTVQRERAAQDVQQRLHRIPTLDGNLTSIEPEGVTGHLASPAAYSIGWRRTIIPVV